MNISQRLFLAVVPAIVGVFTVAGLAYWGHYHRAAPEWVVIAAAVSAYGSLILAWQNTRYVARRIERLAGRRASRDPAGITPLTVVRNAALPGTDAGLDELDSIEQVVDHLSNAVSVAEAGRRERERAAADRIEEYAVLLDETAAAVHRQLDEARLALHILRENHFGTLNENQAELLDAACLAAEAAGAEAGRLQEIAHVDRGALHARRDAIRIPDLLHNLRPQLEADGAKTGVTVTLDLLPGLPRVIGDRIRLQQALELLLRHVVRRATPGSALVIAADAGGGMVRVVIRHGPAPSLDGDVALARRIIDAHGGSIEVGDGWTIVAFPLGSG